MYAHWCEGLSSLGNPAIHNDLLDSDDAKTSSESTSSAFPVNWGCSTSDGNVFESA